MRLCLLLLLLCCATAAVAQGAPSRVEPDRAAVDDLPQGERWALLEAQKVWGRGQWEAAALRYEQFLTQFPLSLLADFAAYRRADALIRHERGDTAITVLVDLIDLDPGAAIVPEALLLLARTHQHAGRIEDALVAYRRILSDFATSTAATPARLGADTCLRLNGERTQRPVEELYAERLQVLAPLSRELDLDPRNLDELRAAGEQLVAVALAAGESARPLALISAIDAVPEAARRGRTDQVLRDLRQRSGRSVLDSAWTRADDALATRTAQLLWSDDNARWLGLAEWRLEWTQHTLRHPGSAATARALDEESLRAALRTELAALAVEASERLATATGESRRAIGWMAARLLFAADRPDAAVAAARDGLTRPWSRQDARHLLQLARNAGVAAERLGDLALGAETGLVARQVQLDQLVATAQSRSDGAALAARSAVGLAQALETDDAERADDYLDIQAQLLRHVLREHDAAIVAYAKRNRPPGTDLAIADTLAEKGDHRAALAKYREVHALYAATREGALALLRAGVLAHQKLDDRALAVNLLRQVCDEFPNTNEYSEAHRYLQARLDVTYTGGGGSRK